MSIINLSKSSMILSSRPAINFITINSFSMLSENNITKSNINKKNLNTSSLLTHKKTINNTTKTFSSTRSIINNFSKKRLFIKKLIKKMSTTSDNEKIVSVKFEVFGKVQGVFFRKYTKLEGEKLGLRGWCMNTTRGTVQGLATGKESQIEKFKEFLQYTGSPKSIIDHAEFSISDKEADETGFVIYRC
ncbi:Acylphosphatase-domain-containing protein [Neocallimastix sp. 'constans']